jgi:hypothetical protein
MKRQRRMTFDHEIYAKKKPVVLDSLIEEEETVQHKLAKEFINKIIIISQDTIKNNAYSK